jgi:hypothetical protein
MRQGLGRRAHPAVPGAPFVAVLVIASLLAAACADGGPSGPGDDRGAPPAPPSVSPPVPRAQEPPAEPTPGLVEPVGGHRSRRVHWRLVQAAGDVVVVEVQAGGAPCDAITGIDVVESSETVELTVWAGRTPGARCRGVPAVLGTFRVRVPLDAPLGERTVRRG